MLKFKITSGRMASDLKKLEVTDMERQENTYSDVPYTDYVNSDNVSDELTYKFWVKDLYNIQSGSHLTSFTNVVLNNTDETMNPKEFKDATYMQEVIVNNVSKADGTLSFNIKKEIPLSVDSVHIETRYNLIRYKDNRWEKMVVDRAWLDSALPDIDGVTFKEVHSFCKEEGDAYVDSNDKIHIYGTDSWDNGFERINPIDVESAAYGVNARKTYDNNGNLVTDSTVFYYENDTWKEISLVGDTLEGCLNGETISLKSFHEYDERNLTAIPMRKEQLYYTRENYLILDFSGTHYFGMPNETKKIEAEYDTAYYLTTDYGREVVESIDYPKIYMYLTKYGNSSVDKIRVTKECNIENMSRLVFNYDSLKESAKVIDYSSEWVIDDDGLPKKKINEQERGIDDSEIQLLEDTLYPYDIIANDKEDYPYQEGFVGNIDFRRDNFFYDGAYGTYSIIYDTTVNVIQIPISQKFENDLHHNDMLKTHFVDKTMAAMVNPIMDMEKDVYTPAIHASDAKKDGEFVQINSDYNDAYKLIFNLHFREHCDATNEYGQKEEWKCERDCYWNGTKELELDFDGEKKKIIDLRGRIFNYPLQNEEYTMKNKEDYFSYFGEEPTDGVEDSDNHDAIKVTNDYNLSKLEKYRELRKGRTKLSEYQSDLLSYLGFTNNDVKYQKSKLKKSFLRISFYDSDNIGNQNLLHTSTIFLDSGGLFAKYIKNIDTEDEYKATDGSIYTAFEFSRKTAEEKKTFTLNGEPMAKVGTSLKNDKSISYNVSGVRVNREPMRKAAINVKSGDLGDNIDELERLRMSSQIVVTDKYSSKNSSEGFYFYNYKSGDAGVFPSEIYMRVEFNHAGYGRTIPFMMPYIRKNEEDAENGIERYKNRANKIKTFDDICYDWSEVDFDKGVQKENIKPDDQIGYGTIRYMKYCHIKWKYRYDKNTQKHIYYLDPDTYGTGVTSENGHGHNIILNLYEGKIR